MRSSPSAATPLRARPPMLPRLADHIVFNARHRATREVLVSGEERVTWGELPDRLDAIADALVSHGVTRGSRIAVWAAPSVESLLCYLACVRIGATFVGVNPKYVEAEVLHVVDDSTPTVFLAATQEGCADVAGVVDAVLARRPGTTVALFTPKARGGAGLDDFVPADLRHQEAVQALVASVQPDDAATIVYTSGTTGVPKGAILTQKGLAYNYWHTYDQRYMDWLKVPAYFTINHLAGLGDVASLTVVAGGTMYPLEDFDAPAILSLIEREKLTYLPGLVTHFQLMFRDVDLSEHDLSSLEFIWWGGAAIPDKLLRLLKSLAPRAGTDFGQTETMGPLIFTPTDATDEQCQATIGRPSPIFPVRLADPDGNVVPVGTPGEIQATGVGVSPGYWGRAEATRDLYTQDGWLRTGDLAVQRPDGFLAMVGRAKEMFKSGGYNLYPMEIEAVLDAHPAVEMSVVVPAPDELYQEVGVAYLVLAPGRESTTEEELRDHLRGQLANYKVPKRFVLLERFPQTPVGKVDKERLRRHAAGADSVTLDEVAGRSPDEGRLTDRPAGR
ncbi:class I adenylate-forming enzyme family protein [Streptomyces sp. NPDC001663]|uniref:class I adenylate-forming enzyme family protein n=1 Tax=Streptomyces sp. NPDC001663 TaxID=3364597 RepID=UPI0036CAF852